MATFSPERKRRIFEHLSQTSNFIASPNNNPSNQMDTKKQRIMEHIERTRG